jgi:hypothetical protein
MPNPNIRRNRFRDLGLSGCIRQENASAVDYVRVRPLYAAGVAVWIIGVAFGLMRLWAYDTGPGAAATAPGQWPAGSAVAAPRDTPVLVVLLHPQCSCSQATLAELARLHARAGGNVSISVLVLSPAGAARSRVEASLWRQASAMKGVRVMADADGAEARRFGAATSGQALLYDRSGRLIFSGGITAARGHEGDNAGRTAIETLIRNDRVERASTLVFGCSLFGPPPQAGAGQTP